MRHQAYTTCAITHTGTPHAPSSLYNINRQGNAQSRYSHISVHCMHYNQNNHSARAVEQKVAVTTISARTATITAQVFQWHRKTQYCFLINSKTANNIKVQTTLMQRVKLRSKLIQSQHSARDSDYSALHARLPQCMTQHSA